MRQRTLRLAALNASLLACMCAHSALAAPGEDPVTITGKVVYLQLPTAGPARSTALNLKPTMPDDAQAKISRFVAKAYAPLTGDVKTEKDVVTMTRTNSMNTTCTQSVGSNSAPANHSPNKFMSNDQVVVLRGDLVNICN